MDKLVKLTEFTGPAGVPADAKLQGWLRRRRPWLSLLLLVFAVQRLAAAEAPAEALAAASQGLPGFLASVPPGDEAMYGFVPGGELTQARLGAPLRLYTITPAALAGGRAAVSVGGLLADTTMWYFPVQVGEEVKAMLVVDRMEDGWRAVSFGYAPLAREWNVIAKQWPAAKGFHPRLAVVFQAQQYWFTVPEVDDRNLTPVATPGGYGPKAKGGYAALHGLAESVRALQPAVAKAVAEPPRAN